MIKFYFYILLLKIISLNNVCNGLHRISYQSLPKQVHLALTGNPNEMSITWITFHTTRYPNGVETFVDYWEYKNEKASLKTVTAERTKYKYSDKIVGYLYSENDDWNNYANIRYIHKVVLKGLIEHKRYEYKVGYYIPSKTNGILCISKKFEFEKNYKYLCKKQYRNKVFNFVMLPWTNTGDIPFTIAIFGNMSLKKPNNKRKFFERTSNYDKRSPDALKGLVELVHRDKNPKHKLLYKPNHPIYFSHLNTESSGLKMQNVQLILHIDASSDLSKWENEKKNGEFYNVGDHFMSIIEDISAYVPYHVIAGNIESDSDKYKHFESRFTMPMNKHLKNHYYHFTVGPIFFLCVNTELYYLYDLQSVINQYEFINTTLKYANSHRQQHPWLVVVQHRSFYCNSTNKEICNVNKFHKNGFHDPENPLNKIYGLEELYNKYNVDLVLSGQGTEFETFPPIQLHDKKNKVIPYKYWWQAKRFVNNDRNTKTIEHNFMAFRDPIAPTYVNVGQPGDNEGSEISSDNTQLETIKKYNTNNSITLLHYPGAKSFIAVRQVDVNNGYVPSEFALEKTFYNYNKNEICNSIKEKVENKYQLETNSIINDRMPNKNFLKDTIEFSIDEYFKFNLKESEVKNYHNTNDDIFKKEKEILLKEIGTNASENSKVRALLNAYNLNRQYPWDTQLDDFYNTTKQQVCGIFDNNKNILKMFDTNKEKEQPKITKMRVETKPQFKLPEKDFTNASQVKFTFGSQSKVGDERKNSNIRLISLFQFSAGNNQNISNKVKKERRINVGKKVGFSQNIEDKVNDQNSNFKPISENKRNGELKSGMKTSKTPPKNVQFETKFQNASQAKTPFDSQTKVKNIGEDPKNSSLRVKTKIKYEIDSQENMRLKLTTEFNFTTQTPKKTENQTNKKIKWEKNDLLYFANLFAYFYKYGTNKKCRDEGGYPNFKLFKLSYDIKDNIQYFHLDANEAINIIKNTGNECVMIHYVTDDYNLNYETLLHYLFSKNGLEINEKETITKMYYVENQKYVKRFVPLSIVLRKIQQSSDEGEFFKNNAKRIEVTKDDLVNYLKKIK